MTDKQESKLVEYARRERELVQRRKDGFLTQDEEVVATTAIDQLWRGMSDDERRRAQELGYYSVADWPEGSLSWAVDKQDQYIHPLLIRKSTGARFHLSPEGDFEFRPGQLHTLNADDLLALDWTIEEE